MTNREGLEASGNREFARFLASVAGCPGNEEEVDFWEHWLKEEKPQESKKYSESDIKTAIQTVLLKKAEDLVNLTQMYDIEEGECVGYHKALIGLLDALHIEYAENEFKPLI